MNAPDNRHWLENNQQALTAELDCLCRRLQGALADPAAYESGPAGDAPDATAHTLDFLAQRLRLSGFERAILLLCAGVELHPDIGPLCARLHGDDRRDHATFGLALTVLPEAHWSALSPGSPLRHWQLVQADDASRITRTRLALDERILHFLLGDTAPDYRLRDLTVPVQADTPLPPSQQGEAGRLALALGDSRTPGVVVLRGSDAGAAAEVAASASSQLGMHLMLLRAQDIPDGAEQRAQLARLFDREHLLSGSVLLIDARRDRPTQLSGFVNRLQCPVIVQGDQPAGLQDRCITFEINKPTGQEQGDLWREALGFLPGGDVAELVPQLTQFDLGAASIAAAAQSVRTALGSGRPLPAMLWQHCRQQGRDGLDQFARRIVPQADWDDIILPEGQRAILRDISRQVRHRATVYEHWGFARKSERGLGICALFAGESGTGKTMAAEVLARELDLDLYRIDLSAVVSKYIGETEKNLERLFRAAQNGGAILLFDEADALFGKRSEVRDSHDRYANIELAYLLQRMESYKGLSILTSNLKSSLDTAFLRRIRFVVQFPFPDVAQRVEIWRRVFPDALPRAELNTKLLGRLDITGGNIRNIAMNAAFLAADRGQPLSMADLARATRMEYAKLEKPLSEAELGQWR